MDIFNWSVEGHFMWTVRNELEPRWNYIEAYDKGWVKNKPIDDGSGFSLF